MISFDFLLQNTALYPFRLAPVYKDHLWGGERFRTLFQRDIPSPLSPLAESWEICDHPDGESVIQNGPLRGKKLHEIVQSRPKELFGLSGNFPDRFPLILKYLDAASHLSVQIHPDDETAQKMGYTDHGKTEAWVVVDATPGSVLWLGTDREYTREEAEKFIRSGTVKDHLNSIEAKIGDCFLLRPGTLHALGAGILIAEVQTSSNITFRVYDWDRVDGAGHSRELKIDEAVRCLPEVCAPIFSQKPAGTGHRFCERVIVNRNFTVNRWTLTEPLSWRTDQRCHLWTVLEGSVDTIFTAGRRITPKNLSGRDPDPDAIETLAQGDSLLVPAMCNTIRWVPEKSEKIVLLDIVVEQGT